MNDKQIEQEIQAKGLTAPRVTPEHVESVISSEIYGTADDLAMANLDKIIRNDDSCAQTPARLLTFCVLVLRNGFTVTGESACASPENFDAELGRKIARQNAVNKVWMLEGYLLKERLANNIEIAWQADVTQELIGSPVAVSRAVDRAAAVDLAAAGLRDWNESLDTEQAARAFVGGTFGQALDHIKRGGKVAREGWNGKGMHLYLWDSLFVGCGPGKLGGFHMEPCIVMYTAQGKRQPGWLASQNDMLATDWHSVE